MKEPEWTIVWTKAPGERQAGFREALGACAEEGDQADVFAGLSRGVIGVAGRMVG
jgi:hypothetical protein